MSARRHRGLRSAEGESRESSAVGPRMGESSCRSCRPGVRGMERSVNCTRVLFKTDFDTLPWGLRLAKKQSKPGKIHLQIVDVLKRFPEGATGGTIRLELEKEGLRPEDQTHLDRRKRDLKKWFVIKKIRGTQEVAGKQRPVILYKYVGERAKVEDQGQIGQRLRAEVIRGAHGCYIPSGESLGITLFRREAISFSAKNWQSE